MKRILLLLIAGFFLAIFVLSSNSNWMKQWALYRYSAASKIPSDKYRFGDLYGFSYLYAYKKPHFIEEDVKPYYVHKNPGSNVQLYSICDSYLWTFMTNDSLLRNAESYRYTRWDYEAKQFHLDSSKQNILLLEMVERRVRTTVRDTAVIYKHLRVVNSKNKEGEQPIVPISWINSHLFNKSIEDNLDFNLFSYPLFTPFKELKAQLNYSIFGRKNQDIVISKTKDAQLYYEPTIDTLKSTSSFKHLSAGEVDTMVTSLNQVYKHYRRAGFSEVYLVLMPNPVSIVEPEIGTYNQLTPRIQNHKALQMPYINVYKKFRPLRNQPIYQSNDSHWSKEGFLLGVAQIDSMLATHRK